MKISWSEDVAWRFTERKAKMKPKFLTHWVKDVPVYTSSVLIKRLYCNIRRYTFQTQQDILNLMSLHVLYTCFILLRSLSPSQSHDSSFSKCSTFNFSMPQCFVLLVFTWYLWCTYMYFLHSHQNDTGDPLTGINAFYNITPFPGGGVGGGRGTPLSPFLAPLLPPPPPPPLFFLAPTPLLL